MEIRIKNHNPFWVVFNYSTNERGGKVTKCLISQDREELVECSVTCSKSDVFKKSKGRKLALTKVLDILQLSKKERTEFWNQYHNRIPINEQIQMSKEDFIKTARFFYDEGRASFDFDIEETFNDCLNTILPN